jgi:hypothetical protein
MFTLLQAVFVVAGLLTSIILVAAIFLFFRSVEKTDRPPRDSIEKWAAGQSLTVIRVRRRILFTGPYFFFPTLRGMLGHVFRVELENEAGDRRGAWICVPFGPREDVDVIWDV